MHGSHCTARAHGHSLLAALHVAGAQPITTVVSGICAIEGEW